jgi:hypothetical protein
VIDTSNEIKWHPRLPQWKLVRLYESDAKGLLDTELLEDVAVTLYLRCLSIIMVGEAEKGRVHCPRCHNEGRSTIIDRGKHGKEFQLICPTCHWSSTWGQYLKSYQRKQLSIGGAGIYFREYVKAYRKVDSPKEKMLAVDRVIHQFHYNILDGEHQPTRANCVNLIEGTLTQTVQLLNSLHNTGSKTKEKWSQILHTIKAHPKP